MIIYFNNYYNLIIIFNIVKQRMIKTQLGWINLKNYL